jgi:polyribonucleotide nucleotidyltransferase
MPKASTKAAPASASPRGAYSVSAPISGTTKTLTFETGKLSQQSQGAVVASIGPTTVLATANAAKGVRDGIDFFPLTVDVEERAYAAGKIPGSFFRREGRPTDAAILTCRLTDRPLRPSFPDGYRNETQIVITVLGADQVNPHDVLSINAASAALMLSGIPFDGPIGAVRLAYSQEGDWIAHPTFEEGDESTFELVVAGRQLPDGDVAIMMVEAGGTEKSFTYYANGAPKVTEEVIADGLGASKTWIKESIALQLELVKAAGQRDALVFSTINDYEDDVWNAVVKSATKKLEKAVVIVNKAERNEATDTATIETIADLCGVAGSAGPFSGREKEVKEAVRALTKKLVRKNIVEKGIRIDGRGPKDIRALSSEVGILPTAHGTGLFQRGETQVMNVCTLGMPKMNQLLDTLEPVNNKRYMHHYNMPPSANGETGRVGSPKRREIGHGILAERALLPVIPSMDEFPYTLRLVSEVLASNGSTSMGSVCSSSLSLMDAGVPIKAPVAGIAMGLVFAEGKYTTLTDILGAEDAFGDMDFKVAGTADAVTALQLDTKIDGIPADVLAAALQQAKEARLQILEVMNAAIAAPREEVGETAPKIVSFEIPLDKIGEVIGPKGKVINTIQQETGADIAVDDDGMVGTVTVGATERTKVDEAVRRIQLIIEPPKADVGGTYTGKVVSITKFGAFINILPGRDGLLHISKVGKGERVNNVEDVLSLGQEIEVRVDDIDVQGKISLQYADMPPADTPRADRGPRDRDDRGGRGGDRDRGPRRDGDRDRGPRRDGDRDRGPRSDRGGDRDRGPRRDGGSGGSGGGGSTVSFSDDFDAQIAGEFGDLGPVDNGGDPNARDDRGDRGGDGGGPRRRRR